VESETRKPKISAKRRSVTGILVRCPTEQAIPVAPLFMIPNRRLWNRRGNAMHVLGAGVGETACAVSNYVSTIKTTRRFIAVFDSTLGIRMETLDRLHSISSLQEYQTATPTYVYACAYVPNTSTNQTKLDTSRTYQPNRAQGSPDIIFVHIMNSSSSILNPLDFDKYKPHLT